MLQSRIDIPESLHEIAYRGTGSYLADLYGFLSPINEDYERLISAYVWLGFLKPDEAISTTLPVDLTITDLRHSPGSPLPPPLEYPSLALRIQNK